MFNAATILVAILGLAVLMIVHEGGHHLVARAFGLRVIRFSIGFGPALWRHQPRGSETVYQVALIPFLAYVQIAGMNPFEESDPEDTGSYANASLTARIATVFAGPLANYLFASVLFLVALLVFGKPTTPLTTVNVIKDTPAAAAEMKDGDKIVRINGTAIAEFEQMRQIILKHPGKEIDVQVLRDGQTVDLKITPEAKETGGQIGVQPKFEHKTLPLSEALTDSVIMPAMVVQRLVVGLGRIITQKEKPDVSGPVGIVKHGARMVEQGGYELLYFLGILSAYLGGFNLLPVPALDGGRLMFLGYEAVARRKPNAKIEAQIHAVGLLMFLALIAVVTINDVQR